jgi:hypothetical protein
VLESRQGFQLGLLCGEVASELKGALKAGEKGKAKITGTATAADGEKAQDSFKVKLRGR